MSDFRIHLALGDPQAPFATVLAVLEHAGVLNAEGCLASDVQLITMGDHFDWGLPAQRERAASDAIAFVAWCAAHPASQVLMLLGNHDVARVGELSQFSDDEAFARVRSEADRAYRLGQVDLEAQARLLEAHPQLADAELLARDFAAFSTEQARMVELLLRAGRFRLGHAHRGLLLVHAGVTSGEFERLGIDTADAAAAAAGLNAFLDERVALWSTGALDLAPFHRPGSRADGPARGALVHRPADPACIDAADFEGPPRRRFDPRELPSAFAQAIGHVRDERCRTLMPQWCEPHAAGDGPLRSLLVEPDGVRYLAGCAEGARLFFTDGGMAHVRPERYQLLDLDTRRPFAGRR